MKVLNAFKILSSNKPPFTNVINKFIIEFNEEFAYEIFNTSINDFLSDNLGIFADIRNLYDIDIHADKYELVVAGQYDNINGWEAELAPAIEPSEKTLFEYFGDDVYYLSFYLRPILSPQNLENQ